MPVPGFGELADEAGLEVGDGEGFHQGLGRDGRGVVDLVVHDVVMRIDLVADVGQQVHLAAEVQEAVLTAEARRVDFDLDHADRLSVEAAKRREQRSWESPGELAFPLDGKARGLLKSYPMSADSFASESELLAAAQPISALRHALNEVLFGQPELIDLTICGVIARGHVLLEGLPGMGKTELVKGLSKAIGLTTRRVQFTPDLLPGDITGNPVLQEVDGRREFVFQPGPVFTNLLLADEINRASPKTQSALLEAMQERRVTVLGQTHALPDPFFVLATQNPIELEGTYPLPEAQVDRFLFKLDVKRSDASTLARIITHRELGVEPEVPAILTRESFASIQALARRIYLPEVVADYIARLVEATHPGMSRAAEGVRHGASPRAALSLAAAAKARALMQTRPNASFEDVQALAGPVLRHRVLLDYTAKMDGRTTADVVRALLAEVPAHALVLPKTLKEEAR